MADVVMSGVRVQDGAETSREALAKRAGSAHGVLRAVWGGVARACDWNVATMRQAPRWDSSREIGASLSAKMVSNPWAG